jgi:uncharacterized membrane protein HdeD (DUF308 family)
MTSIAGALVLAPGRPIPSLDRTRSKEMTMAHQWNEEFTRAHTYPGGQLAWAAASLTSEQVKRARRVLLAVAALALISGAVSIVIPAVTSVTMTIFIGWVLLFAGVTAAINTLPSRSGWRRIEAVLAILAGLYLLVLPLSGTITLTFVLAVWLLASGVTSLTVGIRGGEPWAGDRTMAVLGGVLSMLLGVLIAVELPSSAAWAIGLLVGVNLLFWGVRAIVAASLLRRLTEEM